VDGGQALGYKHCTDWPQQCHRLNCNNIYMYWSSYKIF